MARRRLAVLFDGEILVEEEPLPPIPARHVLVRVEYGVWSGLDTAVALGLVWVRPGRVLGLSGVGRVVESGVGSRLGSGARVVPAVFRAGLAPVLDTDGWLASYTVVPEEALTLVPDGLDARVAALAPLAGLACTMASALSECRRPAVLGCGWTAMILCHALLEEGVEPRVYGGCGWTTSPSYHKLLEESHDCVALATLDPSAVEALEKSGAELVVIHPVVARVYRVRVPGGRLLVPSEARIACGVKLLEKTGLYNARVVEARQAHLLYTHHPPVLVKLEE